MVECSKDRDLGTGVPLGRFDCLSEHKWYSRGILGPLLMEISIKPDTPINVYTLFCLNTAKSKFSLVSPVADW